MTVAEMAVSLFAVDRGYLDEIEIDKIADFEAALHNYMQSEKADLMQSIMDTGDFNDEIEATLKQCLEDFKANHSW